MSDKSYNGWSSYETWAVKLWMDNDEGSHNFWRELSEESWKQAAFPANQAFRGSTQEESAVHILAERLKADHEESLPELNGFAADLLNAAMSEVDWREIAESLIADAKEALEIK